MKKGELLFVLFLIVSVVILLYEAQDYYVLARQFPQLVGGVTLFLLVWDLAAAALKRKRKEPRPSKADKPAPDAFVVKRWITLGVSLAVYVALLPWLGFLLMTTVLMFSLLWFFNVRRPVTLVVYTGATVGSIYGIFVKLLYVPLPPGSLW